nr:MAG TPA: hypothetical protein [Siphoviridae sp. ctweK11]DAK46666.1 MAG TPA: hypothetical protein [Caudoviricetes sp.]DAS95299.1 MAG TPA: hypothetical protein [Caudoviricetes sp.]DAW32810.1 MAG TPA: hypothetical protein [Caudoviricetes sp.]
MNNNLFIQALKAIGSLFSGCLIWFILLALIWGLAMILYP